MTNTLPKNANLIKVAIINYEHALASAILGIHDIFSMVNQFCCKDDISTRFEIHILNSQEHIQNFNMQINFDSKVLNFVEMYDLIIIPPLIDLEHTFATNPILIHWLQKQYTMGVTISSVCIGSYILAQAGLLDNTFATSHWTIEKKMKHDFPTVKLKIDKLIVEDNNIITAGGVSAYMDLCLYLTRRFISKEISYICANYLGIDAGRASQKHYKDLTFIPSENHDIQEVLAYLKKNFTKTITIKDMAKLISVSERTFLRYFKHSTGELPTHYLQKLRVEEAKRLLLFTRDSFEHITYSVGYSNTSTFRNLFKNFTGLTPKMYRDYFMVKM